MHSLSINCSDALKGCALESHGIWPKAAGFSIKQQFERVNFSSTWAMMSKTGQSSRIRQIISMAYVSANSDLSNTG